MVLIPARRVPWVTLVLGAACFAAFALTGFGTWNTPFKTAERNERALRYFMDHPYLALRAEVENTLFGADQATNRTVIDGLKASHPAPAEDVAAREQVQLDRLVAGAFSDPAVDPFQRFGLVPAHPQPLAWVTHLFLHPGWLALLGNLLLLYLIGPFLEEAWGALYPALFVVAGVAAGAAMVFTHRDSTTPVVGAAGAVAGCVGALLARHRMGKVPFSYWAVVRSGNFELPAWSLAAVWLLVQAMIVHFAGAGAAGAAAGLAAGLAVGAGATVALGKTVAEPPRVASQVADTSTRPAANTRAVLAEARKAREDGDLEIAIAVLRQHLSENPGDRDTVLALWDVSVERGSAADVAPAMKGVVRAELQNNQLDVAAAHWVELIRFAPTMTLDTSSLLKMVPPLAAAGRKDDALAVLRRAVLTAGTNLPTGIALRIAALGAGLDARLSRSVVQLVMARPGLDPGERLQAEKLLAALPPAEAPAPAPVGAPTA